MGMPDYGAAPLAKTWLLVRVLQLISMIIIIGITANFVAEINSDGVSPPSEVVGTLSVTSIAALYCLISIPFFYAQAYLGLLIFAGIDSLILLAFIVVSCTTGKPLSFVNCAAVGKASAAATAESTSVITAALPSSVPLGSKITFFYWATDTRAACFESKAIWGVSIALCILFATSMLLAPTLWLKVKRRYGPPPKAVV